MERINQMLVRLYLTVTGAWEDFKESERGDTNFVSMLIIIAIVVAIAGVFLALVTNDIIPAVGEKVRNFIRDV